MQFTNLYKQKIINLQIEKMDIFIIFDEEVAGNNVYCIFLDVFTLMNIHLGPFIYIYIVKVTL